MLEVIESRHVTLLAIDRHDVDGTGNWFTHQGRAPSPLSSEIHLGTIENICQFWVPTALFLHQRVLTRSTTIKAILVF